MAVRTDRRAFFRYTASIAAALAGFGGVGVSVPARAQTATRMRSLQRIAYLLYPFPELGAEPYERVARAIAADASAAAVIEAGLDHLNELQQGNWLDKSEASQIADLEAVESGDFFQYLLPTVRAGLFNDRAVWRFLGYGGSSMEFGGYLDHGLDDIDWLEDD